VRPPLGVERLHETGGAAITLHKPLTVKTGIISWP
jgi:hypothetical protein